MKITLILGLTAGALTTASFLPQAIKTIKLKETKDISLWMYMILTVGVCLWLVYGFLIEELPVILANLLSLTLILMILFYKIRYG
ncbi:SemiSWEET transporter [Candidatus Woesearchaeota archaeon]|nr:SemiSWEET transporter [Candidatus Woesearchaeota archaeon]